MQVFNKPTDFDAADNDKEIAIEQLASCYGRRLSKRCVAVCMNATKYEYEVCADVLVAAVLPVAVHTLIHV